MESIEQLLTDEFSRRFGVRPGVLTWAPGRVNIIGEHIDYSGGRVLPIAIGKRIYAAAVATGSGTITLASGNLKGETVFSTTAIKPVGDWGDYPRGVVSKLIEAGYPVDGFSAFFLSDLPMGAGVSSSAAMEVVVCYLLQKLFDFSIPPGETALLCQRAEHEFSGTQCGIMDQFVSVAGSKGNALLLDCSTLEHRHIPLSLGDHVLVACDSRVERRLASSEYNKRRAECEEGLGILSKRIRGLNTLGDVSPSQLEQYGSDLPETILRRCRHAVSENARVAQAVEAMERGDTERLGRLMNESHDSLRDDYEVSCPELDLLVETARGIDGVLGSRLTGAGFGGSTISLVHRSCIDSFQADVSRAYLGEFDLSPRFFECIASDGAERAHGN
jgi:galactokinase